MKNSTPLKHLTLKAALLSFLLFISSYGLMAQTAILPSGTGTSSDPYLIATLNNLYWIADQNNNIHTDFTNNYFKQTANIDALETSSWFGGLGWDPIGNGDHIFFGTYDGQGYTISNLFINRASSIPLQDYIGLFGYCSVGTIKDLGTINVSFAGGQYTAGLIGVAEGTVLKCYSTGSIVGSDFSGGLIGYNLASVNNCYSTCSVAGNIDPSDRKWYGGFVGYNDGGAITDCYATGTVTGDANNLNIGGFVGEFSSGTITNCYSAGLVNPAGGSSYGGFSGANTAGTATGCFWDTQTSGQSASADGTGKTTAEMQTTSTYSGWNFSTPWNRIDTKNNKYPYLVWQVLPFTATVTTTAISAYGVTSATMGGIITADGGATVTERGVVYSSTDATPTIGETGVTKNANGTGIGTFSKSITGLSGNTTYNVCAYATNSAGTSYGTATNFSTLVAVPTVTGISPINGPTTGTTSVTITGADLTAASAVMFGGTNATGFTVNSATQITATAPAGSAGSVDITVTTAGGTSATSGADQFTYVATPTVTGLSTTSGPTAGSTTVVITGTNFLAASAVKFGSTNATGYTINSATQITATSPAGSAGAVDITVTTTGGTSATSSADQFTYIAAPTVTGLSTTSGPTVGSTSVVITGTNFLAASAVKFGSTNATGYTINSATQITATSPAGSAGSVDITVTTTGGTSATSGADQFTYVAAPTVTGLSTTSGPTAGSTTVVITGTNFLAASAVKFGSTNATGYTINSATQITATSPAGSAGVVDITVTTTGGTSATSGADQFTYVAAPTITGLSTTSGPTAGSTTVVITGTNFLAASAVKFGSTNATGYTINSATQITATSPAGSAGVVDITVTTTGGTSATSGADQFTYVAAPTITGLSTTSGPTAGSTTVVITGTNFLAASAVKFGSTNATGYTINSATQITATSPAGSAGVVDITVTTTGGTSATSGADQFTYVAAPTITGISTTSGPTVGSTSVVITGTNFLAASAVKFGSTNATGYTINSATQITATSPAGSAGAVDITVTTTGGTSATSGADQFTYVAAPSATSIAASSISGTAATLNGTINANNASTTVTFEYGLTTSYGTSVTADQSPVTGTSATVVSYVLTGLTPNTTYHYRVIGINGGGTTNGADQTFTTQSTSQTISFGALDNKTYGDASYNLTATSTSGLAISYSSDNTAVATVSGSTVTIVGAGTTNITASQAGNTTYTAAANVIQQLIVNKKAVIVTATTDTKTYDGTIGSKVAPTVGALAAGDAIDAAPTQAFDNAPIGITHVLTASGLTIKNGSTDVTGNYEISYATATGTINKLGITVTAATDTKTYDGTTVSTAVPTLGTLASGDEINVVPTQTFDNASIGTTHVLTASGLTIKNGSTDVTGNYDINYATGTGTINKLVVTVAATADTKTYDGTTVSTTIPTVGALATGDAINTAPTQVFDNASVGTTHVLTASGLTMKNGTTDATGNYDISYATATGTITAKPLTISTPIVTLSKVYDGNRIAAVTAGSLSGLVASDAGKTTVTAVASYDNATIGTNKTITVAYTLGGSSAGNYSTPADFVTTGAEIYSGTISLQPLSNPTYNANTDLVLSYSVVSGGPTQYKITFETTALAVGFQNVSYTALVTTGTNGSITIIVPKGTRPGKYKGTLQMRNDFGVESTAYDFVMTVNIPTEYIAVKYNRVLVLDNSTRMFSTYQWFKDGVAIDGATKQFYSDPKGLVGTYSIQATTTDGEILYSYPKVLNIPPIKKVTAYPTMVRANQTCTVEISDEAMELDLKGAELYVYSSQGIRVYYSTKVEKLNTIKLPTIDGTYSGRVTTADGQSFLFKVIVAN